MTPNRPLAICLMALHLLSPFGSGTYRSGSSPPSPLLLMPPRRFMAMARASWASWLMEPKDMAPLTNRLTISLSGSTSSSGTGSTVLKRSRPRRVLCARSWSLISAAYCR